MLRGPESQFEPLIEDTPDTADRRATSPAVYGSKERSQINSICDLDSPLFRAGTRNLSLPGYELRS
jgi:hypothetical protein